MSVLQTYRMLIVFVVEVTDRFHKLVDLCMQSSLNYILRHCKVEKQCSNFGDIIGVIFLGPLLIH